jgi:predicted acyltransferase
VLLLAFGAHSDPYGMTTNAGFYLDNALLGPNHMYHGEGVAFDPEGILSTLPAIVNVVIGYYAGAFIQRQGKGYETMTKLLLAGALLIFIALCWNMMFPINKKLWSSPFVLLTTGIDLVLISALLYIVELKQWNGLNWTRFFVVFGKNPLFIYMLSELLIVAFYMIRTGPRTNLHEAVNTAFFQAIAPGAVGSLLFALTYMLLCWFIGWILDRRHIYVRV